MSPNLASSSPPVFSLSLSLSFPLLLLIFLCSPSPVRPYLNSNSLDIEGAWNYIDEDGKRSYDPRLDPESKKFDCIYWWDHVMANPELYHSQWRPFHDPDDGSDIFNAAKNHPDCQFNAWFKMHEWETGNYPWEERMPRPDPYYLRPVVITDYGIVRGYNVTMERRQVFNPLYPKEEFHIEKSISIFLGIPYAKAPDRKSRFERADVPDTWAPQELDASRFRNACVQIDDGAFIGKFQPKFRSNYSEDCLYLNIYAPNYTYPRTMKQFTDWRPTDQNFPVLLFFHGGDFVKGSSSLYPGHILATKDIIVVTCNYRLGPLGFLSTGTKDAPGNYGLWDQWRALQWIQENIRYFYGDPDRVTIMGDEAGAISALLHTYSEWSRPYFHQVIAHGGSEFAPDAVTLTQYLYEIEANRPSRPRHFAEQLADLLGCATPTDQDRLYENYYSYALRQMRDCLKDWNYAARWENIAKVAHRVPREPDNPPWHPVVDEFLRYPFLDALPEDKFKSAVGEGGAGGGEEEGGGGKVPKFGGFPIIYGLDADAGSTYVERMNLSSVDEGLTVEEFESMVEKFVMDRNKRYVLYDETHGPHPAIMQYDRIKDAVRFAYTNWQNQNDDKERLQKAIDMITDYYVSAPILASLERHSRFNATWLYVFDHRSAVSSDKEWRGVPAGKAMEYAFGFPFFNLTEDPRWVFWDHIRNFDINFHFAYDDVDRNVSNITMELIASYVKYGTPTLLDPEAEREVPLGYQWNYWDDFMKNLTWPTYGEGKHYLTINNSLHHPYNCSLDYVFDTSVRIGDVAGKFGENKPQIQNWAAWDEFISEQDKWRLTQSDYEQARTQYSCGRRYRERQMIIDNSQNFREATAGFWNDLYPIMSTRGNVSTRNLTPTPRPRVAFMSGGVYQGIVYALVAILFVLCVAAISFCLCPRNDAGGSKGGSSYSGTMGGGRAGVGGGGGGGGRGSARSTDKESLHETMLGSGVGYGGGGWGGDKGGDGGGDGVGVGGTFSRETTTSTIASSNGSASRRGSAGGKSGKMGKVTSTEC